MAKQSSTRSWSEHVRKVRKQSSEVMYSEDGSSFQEYALAHLDYVHSFAHEAIGRLVRQINQGDLDRDLATMIYENLLEETY